ncbi:hypothetical protein SCREM2_gp62 [Synechococcus phage S-CREM2]|nr:hypothetical protein SCREM2_gp62 [Synechococcus phage S-CREM2]
MDFYAIFLAYFAAVFSLVLYRAANKS